MPIAKITLVRGALTKEQRVEMAKRVTDAIVSVEGEALRQGVQVCIEESVGDGEWSVGGQMLTIEAMQRMREGKAPW